jgi:predicted metal-dependent peptidase
MSRGIIKQPSSDEILATEKRRTAALRMQLLADHPFWGYLLIESELIPSPFLPALTATDGVRRIWYNPTLTRFLTLPELGFVMAHEAGHMILQSFSRRRGRDQALWDAASDYAVNRIVAGILDPEGGLPLYTPPRKFLPVVGRIAPLLDECFDEMTAEAIYEDLRDNPMWDDRVDKIDVRILSGGALEEAWDQFSPDELVDSSICDSDPSWPDQVTFTLDRRPGSWDMHVPPEVLCNQDIPGSGVSGVAWPDIADRLGHALDYADRCNSPGDVPYGIRLAIGRNIPGTGDQSWQTLFRRIVVRSLDRDEYTRARPNRRWLDMGFIVPGLINDGGPFVVIAVDTSASMSQRDLGDVCAEIRPVLARCGDAVLLVHDADIQEVVTGNVAIMNWLDKGWTRGGGGTDHCPVFDWIARSRIDPDLFVGLTDCASQYPSTAPRFPVVWVTPLHSDRNHAPWGQRLWVGPPY